MHFWVLEGLKDIHITCVEVVSDNVMAMMSILQPRDWPHYQNIHDKIHRVVRKFKVCEFHLVKISVNSIARATAKSMIR